MLSYSCVGLSALLVEGVSEKAGCWRIKNFPPRSGVASRRPHVLNETWDAGKCSITYHACCIHRSAWLYVRTILATIIAIWFVEQRISTNATIYNILVYDSSKLKPCLTGWWVICLVSYSILYSRPGSRIVSTSMIYSQRAVADLLVPIIKITSTATIPIE